MEARFCSKEEWELNKQFYRQQIENRYKAQMQDDRLFNRIVEAFEKKEDVQSSLSK